MALPAPGLLAPASDTVVLVAARDALDIVYGVAAGSFVLLLLALLAVVLGVLFQARAAVRAIEKAGTRLLEGEAAARVGRTLEHVEAVASSVRGETERMSASVAKVTDQVTLASRRMEERIEEFNALLAVVQEEAEEVFLDTASTARGVRRGIGALGTSGRKHRTRPRPRVPAQGSPSPSPPATLTPPPPAPTETPELPGSHAEPPIQPGLPPARAQPAPATEPTHEP